MHGRISVSLPGKNVTLSPWINGIYHYSNNVDGVNCWESHPTIRKASQWHYQDSLLGLIFLADDSIVSRCSLGSQGSSLLTHPKLLPIVASDFHHNQKAALLFFFFPESHISADVIALHNLIVKKASLFLMTWWSHLNYLPNCSS